MVSNKDAERALFRPLSPSEQRVASRNETSDRSDCFRSPRWRAYSVLGGFDVRLHPAVTAFAASLIALAPFQAFAQEANQNVSVRDRPRPEYEPLGMRLGGFDLNARLDLDAIATDNLFASEHGGESDVYYTVSPSARLSSHWSRHALAVAAGYSHAFFSDHSNQDSDTGYVAADGRLDVGVDTHINAAARYAREVELRTNPDALTTGKPVIYDVSDVSLSADHRFNRFRVVAGVDSATYNYHDANGIDQDFRDYTQNSAIGGVEAELTPRFGIIGQVIVDHRDYKNTPSLTSDGQTYLAGVALHLTDLIEGRITAGELQPPHESGPRFSRTSRGAGHHWDCTSQ